MSGCAIVLGTHVDGQLRLNEVWCSQDADVATFLAYGPLLQTLDGAALTLVTRQLHSLPTTDDAEPSVFFEAAISEWLGQPERVEGYVSEGEGTQLVSVTTDGGWPLALVLDADGEAVDFWRLTHWESALDDDPPSLKATTDFPGPRVCSYRTVFLPGFSHVLRVPWSDIAAATQTLFDMEAALAELDDGPPEHLMYEHAYLKGDHHVIHVEVPLSVEEAAWRQEKEADEARTEAILAQLNAGDVQGVRAYFSTEERPFEFYVSDEDGSRSHRTPIWLAARSGHRELLEMLHIEVYTPRKRTVSLEVYNFPELLELARFGHVDCLRFYADQLNRAVLETDWKFEDWEDALCRLARDPTLPVALKALHAANFAFTTAELAILAEAARDEVCLAALAPLSDAARRKLNAMRADMSHPAIDRIRAQNDAASAELVFKKGFVEKVSVWHGTSQVGLTQGPRGLALRHSAKAQAVYEAAGGGAFAKRPNGTDWTDYWVLGAKAISDDGQLMRCLKAAIEVVQK